MKTPLLTKQPLLMQGPPAHRRTWTPPQQETPVLSSEAAAPSPGELQVTKVTFQAITKPEGAFEQIGTNTPFSRQTQPPVMATAEAVRADAAPFLPQQGP